MDRPNLDLPFVREFAAKGSNDLVPQWVEHRKDGHGESRGPGGQWVGGKGVGARVGVRWAGGTFLVPAFFAVRTANTVVRA